MIWICVSTSMLAALGCIAMFMMVRAARAAVERDLAALQAGLERADAARTLAEGRLGASERDLAALQAGLERADAARTLADDLTMECMAVVAELVFSGASCEPYFSYDNAEYLPDFELVNLDEERTELKGTGVNFLDEELIELKGTGVKFLYTPDTSCLLRLGDARKSGPTP